MNRNQLIARQVVDDDRTLQDVATEHGITRERVRQIVARQRPGWTASARRQARIDEAAAARAAAVAARAATPRHLLLPDTPTRAAPPWYPKKRYTRDGMIRALRDFHTSHGAAPSSNQWTRLGLHPTPVVIMREFGSWNAALDAAGLPRNKMPRIHYHRWTFDACVDAVTVFLTEPADGINPTASGYDRWARDRDDVPSLATIRNRGAWSEILTAAHQQITKDAA